MSGRGRGAYLERFDHGVAFEVRDEREGAASIANHEDEAEAGVGAVVYESGDEHNGGDDRENEDEHKLGRLAASGGRAQEGGAVRWMVRWSKGRVHRDRERNRNAYRCYAKYHYSGWRNSRVEDDFVGKILQTRAGRGHLRLAGGFDRTHVLTIRNGRRVCRSAGRGPGGLVIVHFCPVDCVQGLSPCV